MTNFNTSKTKENLLKAFAGESQARNRYTFSASAAKKEGYPILEDLFNYTANQEKAHAKQFMDKLKEFSGEELEITGSYPVVVETSTLTLLRLAEKHENNEFEHVYNEFAAIAKEEGFPDIEKLFTNIASIEKVHSDRFKKYADMLEKGYTTVQPFTKLKTILYFIIVFKYSINSSLNSSFLRAYSTVASRNPSLSPTSYLLPSKS